MIEPPRAYGVDMPCFDPEIGRRIEVRLNGNAIDHVISYDMDARQLLRCKTDERGNVVLNEHGDEVDRELLTGDVVALFKD